jgi:hypothetical protein
MTFRLSIYGHNLTFLCSSITIFVCAVCSCAQK